ncbi:MAG: TfoX/Sxy family DNA transformation protein [Paracoccus sp. (in: a-proteobacteria)]|nr:TfoX/Sxy family DNA transformation protein [Paracoccus sp. (in: a-proteobacteria)]
MSDLTSIRNIGPATARGLIAAGVPDAASLRAMGADAAYAALIAHGTRPHFVPYYVLHMALQGRPWNDCKGAEKDALRARFDALVAGGAGDRAIEAALDEIGLPARARLQP